MPANKLGHELGIYMIANVKTLVYVQTADI